MELPCRLLRFVLVACVVSSPSAVTTVAQPLQQGAFSLTPDPLLQYQHHQVEAIAPDLDLTDSLIAACPTLWAEAETDTWQERASFPTIYQAKTSEPERISLQCA